MRLNILGPINNLGYGIATYNIIKAMLDRGIEVAWWPIGGIEPPTTNADKYIQSGINGSRNYSPHDSSIRIWHQHALAEHVGKAWHCGFPIFELDELRENEIHHLQQQDIIFCTSKYHEAVLKKYSKITNNCDIYVVPLGVDTEIFYPPSEPPDQNWTTFLNCGKWEYRKGHDVLVEAFNRAFTPKDRVRLWMMTDNPFLRRENKHLAWEDMYKRSPLGDKISILPRLQYHTNVGEVMRHVDCGVFPSRAEGWNLEALEILACGKELIVTDFSAHTEFCDDMNSYMINIDNVELAYDGIWFDGTCGSWAQLGDPQIDQIVEAMRDVHQKKLHGESIYNREGIMTAEDFTWDNTVNTILEVFEDE